MSTSFGSLGAALSPHKVKRDLARLGPVAVICLVLALAVSNTAVTVLVVIIAGFGAIAAGVATIAALTASRGRAGFAIASYGALTAVFVASVVLAVA